VLAAHLFQAARAQQLFFHPYQWRKQAMIETTVRSQTESSHIPWNKGKIIGQKPPLKPQDV